MFIPVNSVSLQFFAIYAKFVIIFDTLIQFVNDSNSSNHIILARRQHISQVVIFFS